MPVNPEKTAAVDTGRIFEIAGNSLQKLAQQKNAEGAGKEAGDPKRPERVVATEFLKNQKLRNHCYLRRDHHGCQEKGKTECATRPLQAGKTVSDKRTAEQCPHDIQNDEKNTGRDVTPQRHVIECKAVVTQDLRPPRLDQIPTGEFNRDFELVWSVNELRSTIDLTQ